jgi:hypothetical protein
MNAPRLAMLQYPFLPIGSQDLQGPADHREPGQMRLCLYVDWILAESERLAAPTAENL